MQYININVASGKRQWWNLRTIGADTGITS